VPPETEAEAAAGGRPEGAAATERELQQYEVRVGAAKLLMELMQHEMAVQVLDNLLQEDDEVVEVWYLMGVAHNLLKNTADAIEFLLESRRLYHKLGCLQSGILQHTEQLLASYPAAEVASTLEALQYEQAQQEGGGGMDQSTGGGI
jgi:predicted Zn-dependent protease